MGDSVVSLNMLVKILFACLVGLASCQWPAGVSPAACPNYPDCSLTPASYAGAVSAYPAGVLPGACPDYPYCTGGAAVPQGYVNTAGYPAGVAGAACPNYPYCY